MVFYYIQIERLKVRTADFHLAAIQSAFRAKEVLSEVRAQVAALPPGRTFRAEATDFADPELRRAILRNRSRVQAIAPILSSIANLQSEFGGDRFEATVMRARFYGDTLIESVGEPSLATNDEIQAFLTSVSALELSLSQLARLHSIAQDAATVLYERNTRLANLILVPGAIVIVLGGIVALWYFIRQIGASLDGQAQAEADLCRLNTELESRVGELERINQRLGSAVDGMRALASSTTLRELSQRMLETVARNLGAADGALYLLESGVLVCRHTLGGSEADQSIPLPPDQDSAFSQAMETCQPVLEPDPAGSTSRLVFPLIGGGSAPIGVMEVKAKASAPFTARDRDFGLVLVSYSRETYRVVQALERLANSEERFRCIVENTPSAVFLKDLDGRFLLVNRQMEERHGRRSADVVGKTAHDIYPKDYADVLVAQDREALAKNAVVEREIMLPFADDTLHPVVVTKFPVLNADGDAIGVGTVSTDVTDRRRMEEQLRQSQKMEALGQLTGGVAHDFNNLLAIIFGNLDLVYEEMDEEDGHSRQIEDALEAARRGADLTRHRGEKLLVRRREDAVVPPS